MKQVNDIIFVGDLQVYKSRIDWQFGVKTLKYETSE